MRKFLMGAAVLALAGCSAGTDLPIARAGVDKVHGQLNGGRCAEIRDQASSDFKELTSAESWKTTCDQLAAGLGKFVSLAQTGWNDEVGTNGHIIRLNYDSEFEKGKAQEQFLFRIDGGKAVLVGYHVNSDVFTVVPKAPPAPPAAPKPK